MTFSRALRKGLISTYILFYVGTGLPTLTSCNISSEKAGKNGPKTTQEERNRRYRMWLLKNRQRTTDTAFANGPAVIIFEPDSALTENLIKFYGEEAFFESADDAYWYQALLTAVADSMHIGLIYTGADTLKLHTPDSVLTLIRPTDSTAFFYYFFDRTSAQAMDLMEFLHEKEKKQLN